MSSLFKKKLQFNQQFPIVQAPLAGVSDAPFRYVCAHFGADLTYVEMISANALIRENKRTFRKLDKLDEDTSLLGVQIVAYDIESLCNSIEIIEKFYSNVFATIDINMGCPAPKVIKLKGGAFLLQDPKKIYDMVKAAKNTTALPLSVKIRLGWDKNTNNIFEIVDAIEQARADCIYVHGRYKTDSYNAAVDLKVIKTIKEKSQIPIIGNGNIFGLKSAKFFIEHTNVDGLLIGRGSLGNPWIFSHIKLLTPSPLNIDLWYEGVLYHIQAQKKYFEKLKRLKVLSACQLGVCLRKHLLWYVKGLEGAKKIREAINTVNTIDDAELIICEFYKQLKFKNIQFRDDIEPKDLKSLFLV